MQYICQHCNTVLVPQDGQEPKCIDHPDGVVVIRTEETDTTEVQDEP